MRDPRDPGTRSLPLKRAQRAKIATPARPAKSKGMRLGYARKSKDEQDLALQVDALKRALCAEIYLEQVSRAGPRRLKKGTPELDNILRALRPGDTLVVWRLDRLAGSVSELIRIVMDLKTRGIGFESLTEKIDTSTAAGNMFFQIAAVFAEYERNLLIERTYAGLAAAKAQGRIGGRKPSLDAKAVRLIKAALKDPKVTVKDVAKTHKVSRATIYRYVDVASMQRDTGREPGKNES
jgi:DNA invertase Pin-like site-specific DNA recombinase